MGPVILHMMPVQYNLFDLEHKRCDLYSKICRYRRGLAVNSTSSRLSIIKNLLGSASAEGVNHVNSRAEFQHTAGERIRPFIVFRL